MAQDSEVPKAADKGKGKAVDDAKKEKPVANGKKEDDKVESMGIPPCIRCDLGLTVA
jgi:26S proteasome regulatory subunit N1